MVDNKYSGRSSKYQWVICEIPMDINDFSQTADLDRKLHSSHYSPRFSELNDQALQRILDIAEEVLTPHQLSVLKLFLDGYTQMEIAKMMDINQSSVTKSLNGNLSYEPGAKTKQHGGIRKKLRKHIMKDQILKDIFKEMRICDDLMWKLNHPNPKKVYCKTTKHAVSNIYYLASTMFESDDKYQDWIDSLPPPDPDLV